MSIEKGKIRVSEIKPNPTNPRKISKQQYERLKKSIQDFPEMLNLRPVVIDENNIVLGGNMRLSVLNDLGIDEVSYVKVDNLSAEQKNEFIIKDNLSYGQWDWTQLKTDWDVVQLDDWGMETYNWDLDYYPDIITMEMKDIHPHPENYKSHPEDQLEHIMRSVREYGLYRNIIVSADNFIIVGHGLVQALKLMNITRVPVIKVEFNHDDPKALKLLVIDNEASHLSFSDDRKLSEIMKTIKDETGSLMGTGYDDMMLAGLLMVSRPREEITKFNNALEWVGMPEFEAADINPRLVIHFEDEETRVRFQSECGFDIQNNGPTTAWSTWWPNKQKGDPKTLRFTEK